MVKPGLTINAFTWFPQFSWYTLQHLSQLNFRCFYSRPPLLKRLAKGSAVRSVLAFVCSKKVWEVEVEASAGAEVVLGKKKIGGRRAGSSLFCGRCPQYFGRPTEHVGNKCPSPSKASSFRCPKLGLFCHWFSSCSLSWTGLTCRRKCRRSLRQTSVVDSSILALNANVKWTHAGDAVRAFLVAVSCPKTVPGEKFVAAGDSRHFARAYHGECVRVCTLLSGV